MPAGVAVALGVLVMFAALALPRRNAIARPHAVAAAAAQVSPGAAAALRDRCRRWGSHLIVLVTSVLVAAAAAFGDEAFFIVAAVAGILRIQAPSIR